LDKGKSQVSADKFGENYYNRGVYNSVLTAEAIRNAQRITGKKVVNGEDVRRGFEALNISAARWKELGFADFAAPITNVSCSDHNGHHSAYIQQWDGTKWEKVSIGSPHEGKRASVARSGQGLRDQNQPWPSARSRATSRRNLNLGGLLAERGEGRVMQTASPVRGRGLLQVDRCRCRANACSTRTTNELILSVNNIEVIYDHVILVLKCLLDVRGGIVAL
jgi:hypothetical protein